MISPTRPAISWPAPDAPLCDALPGDPTTWYPISSKSPTGSKGEPQTVHRSPMGAASFSAVEAHVARQTFEMWHRQALLVVRSRQVRGSGDRSDRTGLRWSGCHPLAGRLGVVGHRSPTRPAAIRDHESTRRAYAPPSCVPSASSSSSLPSLRWVRAEGRGLEPPRGKSDWDEATGPVG